SRDIVGIRAMEIRARNLFLVQFEQNAILRRLFQQELMFAVRAIAPENVFRLGQQFDLVHPIQDRPVLRLAVANSFWRRNSGCEVFHESDRDPAGRGPAESSELRISSGSRRTPRNFCAWANASLREQMGGCLLTACSGS